MEGQTWRDEDDFNLVVRQISDLAQVCVQEALRVLGKEECLPFAVIGMGKLGARELNYSSDIDLIFLHDGDNAAMQKLGETLFKALSDSSSAGTIHRVDMRLRPDGKSGPLVTSMSYALSYYESYAAAWEWQAMIKSRVIAGDASLGRRFRKFLRGVTWARRADDAHLREMLAMKRRSEATPEGKDLSNVKQGPGSIRDAEWVVQQSQMMVGPDASSLPRFEHFACSERHCRSLVLSHPMKRATCATAICSCEYSNIACSCGKSARCAKCPPMKRVALPWRGAWASRVVALLRRAS
jgi:glutamate-ammonia-ligase adenylyltransferase